MPHALIFPPGVPTLHGDIVSLRELAEADIPAWFERATDAESADLAGDPIPDSIEDGARWLQMHRDRFRDQLGIRWAIVPTGSTESVGTIGLNFTSNEEPIAEIGYVIGRRNWGRGICTAAARLATRYGFDSLGLSEIRAEVLQRNPASIRVLEKLGFHRERAIPGDPEAGGESDDCYLYVLPRPPIGGAD